MTGLGWYIKRYLNLAHCFPAKKMTTEAKKSSILLQKAYFLGFSVAFHSLFVSSIDDPKQNAGSFLTPVFSIVFYALLHGTLGFAFHGSFNNHLFQII